MNPRPILTGVLVLIVMGAVGDPVLRATQGESRTAPGTHMALEDFTSAEGNGLPAGWKAQRNEAKVKQAYAVRTEAGQSFLEATHADQRVYKRIAWDPKAMPIVTWTWRLKSRPASDKSNEGNDLIAAVFVSLDTDLMVIPVATKYVWSATKAKGKTTEGGLFGASEIVLRTGTEPVGEWVVERVNAYEDFKRAHNHEPAVKAWGISLLGGPDVEVDFGPINVSAFAP